MDFLTALQTNDMKTENGMPTHSTSGNYLLDYFFKMGAPRSIKEDELISLFIGALSVNRDLALKALFYNRDCRGGQGERHSFRVVFHWLANYYPEVASELIEYIPVYGRWDDVLVCYKTPIQDTAFDFIKYHLLKGDKLCAKWMPREGKKLNSIAKELMNYIGLSPKSYRKLLSNSTDVVENKMCRKEWGEINYNHVPSQAMQKYKRAFSRNDGDRFGVWINSLTKEDSSNKVNSSQLFPYDIVKSILQKGGYSNGLTREDVLLYDAQWKGLKDYRFDLNRMIAVSDVSGSMNNPDRIPMSASISLGIYLSERNIGPFKDCFITFSNRPKLVRVTGNNIVEKVYNVSRANWEMNTDLEAVFDLILLNSVKYNVRKSDMPNTIIILSDMQFDRCVTDVDSNALHMIRDKYNQSGYSMPNIIFWNLDSKGGVPVKFNDNGVALVSGYSPSILQAIMDGDIDPIRIMMNMLTSERYSLVKVK